MPCVGDPVDSTCGPTPDTLTKQYVQITAAFEQTLNLRTIIVSI
jgi:hypothetical protein